jgi:hypothetical protein
MQGADHSRQPGLRSAERGFCLTNLSTVALVGCALGASVVLWLCIWAVL